MKKIFVTGVNGLLGTNLLQDLLEKGFYVKGLLRNKHKYLGITHARLELIEGNLFDDLTGLLKEVDAVIHIAAETRHDLTDYKQYYNINYNATVQLFNSAIKNHVKKFIFVSTANTLGYGDLSNLGNEKKSPKHPFTSSFYAKSKIEAEEYLLKHKDKINTIIINPTFMLGSYDTKPSSGKIILRGWKKKLILYPSGGKNFVHVKDVSSGIIKSLEKGINGEKYLICNKNLDYYNFYKLLNLIANQKPFMIQIPDSLLIILGYIGDLMRLCKINTDLSSINMSMLRINNFYSNSKSQKTLGIKYRSINDAIKDSLDYFSSLKAK